MDDQEAFVESLKVAEQRRVFRVATLQRLLRISYIQAMKCIDRMKDESRVCEAKSGLGIEYHFIPPNVGGEGREPAGEKR